MIKNSQLVRKPKRARPQKLIVSDTLKRTPPTAEEIQEHIENMRMCFEEWHGPKVSTNCDGFCELAGEHSYCCSGRFFWAHLCITRVDGHVIDAVVAYDDDAPEHCREDNGTPLRVHITDIWPPVWLLNPLKTGDPRVAHIKDK